MADLTPLDQADPGQPVVTAPTILNGARRNTTLDPLAGSRMCVSPCQCPQGHVRPCTPNYDADTEHDDSVLEECESFTFDGFDWFAFDEGDIHECGSCDNIETRLAEIVAEGAAYMLGQELDSAPLTGNPSLQTESVLVNAGGLPAHPRDAASMLMQASALKGQYRSTFFAADHMLPALQPMLSQVNGQWRLLGRPIVFSPGISGDGPAGAPADPGTGYLYLAKGAADYNLSEPDFTGATAERLNREYGRTHMRGIIRFNPACVHAVQVCLKHESCCASGEPLEAPAIAASVGAQAREAARVEAAETLLTAAQAIVDTRARVEAERQRVSAEKAKAEAERAAAEQAEAEAAARLIELHEEPEIEPEPEPVESFGSVPDGTINDILQWVNSNRQRALAAVAHEASELGRNRSTLINTLNEIIEAE